MADVIQFHTQPRSGSRLNWDMIAVLGVDVALWAVIGVAALFILAR